MESLPARRRQLALFTHKLEQTGGTSALLSGFALVAMVELNLPEGRTHVEEFDNNPVFYIFSAVTSVLIALHLFALMVSTSVLPYLKSAIEDIDHHLAQRALTARAKGQALHNLIGPQDTLFDDTTDTSHDNGLLERVKHLDQFSSYISKAWFFANGVGIALFLLQLALISYIKFLAHTPGAGWTGVGTLSPAFVLFMVFIYRFYRKIVGSQSTVLKATAEQVEQAANDYDQTNTVAFQLPRIESNLSNLSFHSLPSEQTPTPSIRSQHSEHGEHSDATQQQRRQQQGQRQYSEQQRPSPNRLSVPTFGSPMLKRRTSSQYSSPSTLSEASNEDQRSSVV
ncbi:hypothetical protein PTSG_05291 [Salpingoeca rosetta]|uniref:Uncharacterized protein n=1 Tax=Salpingoeca rosetta (strain ATCC 50818 / BSB-021) TaxID=946362 RepID=F2UA07_SALR5|nr:uncharacterized protein PTSG_05291 [Salpingoeca rosetta]EGD73582.1 hypothetical protein PTSG_05291 [Salpingoeca rosetta]|eukprot:XP_004993864.1 hypothetical protein PTSG_05291 [Salpingoeca rosetta]